MRPSRSRLTTRHDFGSRGRAWARGSRTSTPPCMIGAVIMKMMSSTNATSTSDVTLMSALSGSSPCPRRPPPPPPPRSPAIRSVLPGPASRRSLGQSPRDRRDAGPGRTDLMAGLLGGGGGGGLRGHGELPLNADINVTSLVDVAFVLLIIFMITAPIMQGGVDVRLPRAEAR